MKHVENHLGDNLCQQIIISTLKILLNKPHVHRHRIILAILSESNRSSLWSNMPPLDQVQQSLLQLSQVTTVTLNY